MQTKQSFWLAGGQWQMESLANFYIVNLSKNAVTPTEEGHEPIWVSILEAEKLLPLPYQKEGLKQYKNFIKNQHIL